MKRSARTQMAALLLALGCSPDAQVDVPIGPITDTVDLPVASIPAALVGADGRLVTLTCSPAAPCPTLPTQEPSVQCTGDRCVVGSFTLRTQNQLVDLSTFSTFQEYAGALDVVSLRRAQLAFTGLRTGNRVGPLELTWSAESEWPVPSRAAPRSFTTTLAPRLASSIA